jgi:hypothetical protein
VLENLNFWIKIKITDWISVRKIIIKTGIERKKNENNIKLKLFLVLYRIGFRSFQRFGRLIERQRVQYTKRGCLSLLPIGHMLEQILTPEQANLQVARNWRRLWHIEHHATATTRCVRAVLACRHFSLRQLLEYALPRQIEQRDALQTLVQLGLRLLQCLLSRRRVGRALTTRGRRGHDCDGVARALAHRRLDVQTMPQLFDAHLDRHRQLETVGERVGVGVCARASSTTTTTTTAAVHQRLL